MVKLTEYEQEMLSGVHGALKQQAMKKVVEYAGVLGAEELCEVTMAHVFCGAHEYLNAAGSDDIEETVAQMQFCTDEKMPKDDYVCYCQSDCGPMDSTRYAEMGVSGAEGKKTRNIWTIIETAALTWLGRVSRICAVLSRFGESTMSAVNPTR